MVRRGGGEGGVRRGGEGAHRGKVEQERINIKESEVEGTKVRLINLDGSTLK